MKKAKKEKQKAKIAKRINAHKKKKKTLRPAASSPLHSLLQQALTHYQVGRYPQAEALCWQILMVDPCHADALYFLGMIAFHSGNRVLAIELLRKALNCNPDHIDAHNSLGIIFSEQGKLTEAETCYRRLIALNPDSAGAHYRLGNALGGQGRLDEAVASYRQAVALEPDYKEAYNNLGNTLNQQGKLTEAEACFRQALTFNRDIAGTHYNLGNALKDQGKLEEAAACFRQALALQPNYALAYNNLGITLKEQGKFEEAVSCYRQALAVQPDYAEAHSNLLFCLNYFPDLSASWYLDEAVRYGRRVANMARAPYADWICAREPERLRLGLVSGDFRNHPVGYFLECVLANIDPTRIELIAYPTHSQEDELTARIRPRFAAWKPLVGMKDEDAARLIHEDGIHVLLDLSGHSALNRLPVFAWKPSPVQATWLGYYASTGMKEMDYILVDPESVPESQQEQFTENVWYLPATRFCFAPPVSEEIAALTPLPALRNRFLTFGCFQNLTKINDGVLAAWGSIFQALPQARLRLQNNKINSPETEMRLYGRLAQSGIASDRVILEKGVPRLDYLAAHSQIDIILDTFPFPGGTTTCEALWMGVPTMTLAGETMLSRQGASLLVCAGLSDWVAKDEEDYVAKVVAHAADLEKLAKLRAGLRQQVLSSPLFNGPLFARNFEKAMWGMWEARRGKGR